MKQLLTIKELIELGYPRNWLYQVAHSKDFVVAGGRRLSGAKSTIRFDVRRLDEYLEQVTIENM